MADWRIEPTLRTRQQGVQITLQRASPIPSKSHHALVLDEARKRLDEEVAGLVKLLGELTAERDELARKAEAAQRRAQRIKDGFDQRRAQIIRTPGGDKASKLHALQGEKAEADREATDLAEQLALLTPEITTVREQLNGLLRAIGVIAAGKVANTASLRRQVLLDELAEVMGAKLDELLAVSQAAFGISGSVQAFAEAVARELLRELLKAGIGYKQATVGGSESPQVQSP